MRDPARIKKILGSLEKYWTANPDLRLYQILGNIMETRMTCTYCNGAGHFTGSFENNRQCARCLGDGRVNMSTYNIEDAEILNKLEALISKERCSTWGCDWPKEQHAPDCVIA